jgi:hypothetical protein
MKLRRRADNAPEGGTLLKTMKRLIAAPARTLWLVLVAGAALPAEEKPAAKTAEKAAPAPAGQAAAAPAKPAFKPEEIEQLVAPIALYPDDVVSQILMASTYPLEVVEASRWIKANKNLKGDKLTAELEKKTWDPSVKSLVNFPQVLAMMDEKLESTQKLGDAFIASQKDVLDAVQRLRAKAKKEGHLESNDKQKVTVEQTVIKIEPTNPQVVYVPTYNPTVVYGTWPYPSYPPYYYYPPGYTAAASMLSFGVGMAVGAAWGYAWGGCNWGGGEVDIDIDKNTNINRDIDRSKYQGGDRSRGQGGQGGRNTFQHDPSHRKGVSYRDQATAQKFGKGSASPTAQSRESFRGRAEQGRQSIQSGGGASARDRAGGAGTSRASAGATSRASGSQGRSSSALSGSSRSGSEARAQSSRGSQSRSSSVSRSSGGGSRGGGSRGGGRGGGGRGGGGRR